MAAGEGQKDRGLIRWNVPLMKRMKGGREQGEVTVGRRPVPGVSPPVRTLLYAAPSLSASLFQLGLFWVLCGREITVSALLFALPRARLLIDTC